MKMKAKYLILLSTIVTFVVCVHVKESGSVKEHVVRREKRLAGMNPELHRAYLNLLRYRATYTPQNSAHWTGNTPSIPVGDEINCYLDVVYTERRGGRCTRLGTNPGQYVCQSGNHIDAQDDCETIIRRGDQSR